MTFADGFYSILWILIKENLGFLFCDNHWDKKETW